MDRLKSNQSDEDAKAFVNRLALLRAKWEGLEGKKLLAAAIEEFGDDIAVTSSFGSESVVELHMLSLVSPSTQVIFLNTGKLFGETLRYRDLLKSELGLTNVSSISPSADDTARLDPQGTLWNSNPNMCCNFRKTLPQERELEGKLAIITGRKRFQTQARKNIPFVDLVRRPQDFGGFRFVINPLANWSAEQLAAYIEKHNLPRHPLVKDGFLSIGCMPCTQRTTATNYRAGRWEGIEKDECGIHPDSFVGGEGI